MSFRLPSGGRLIERDRPISFTFNGRALQGLAGDTLASALLANGQVLQGRSFKYHRPRGLVASGPEEPNALMGLGQGSRFEPNQRATTTELFDGLQATSQNHWPSLEFDVGAVNSALSRFFPAGFYYKTFMQPRAAWKHLFEPFIRRSAGLGRAPEQADADHYAHFYSFADVLVVGGGMAGIAAATAAAETGARVIVMEQSAHWGGRVLVDEVQVAGGNASEWLAGEVARLAAMPNVTLLNRTMCSGVYDHGYALGYQRVGDHLPGADMVRHRLWRVRANRIVTATGAIERPLAFAGNDVPGVMLASAVRDYAGLWGVATGQRHVIVTNNDDGYRTALSLHGAGLEVAAIVDCRVDAQGGLVGQARELGLRVEAGKAIVKVTGDKAVQSVEIGDQQGDGGVSQTISCDSLAMSGGWSPVVHLWSHCGGKLNWDDKAAMFVPDPARPPLGADGKGFVIAAGSASGALHATDCLSDAAEAGTRAAADLGFRPAKGRAIQATAPTEGEVLPAWIMPANATADLRAKAFLDFQNDVKVSDVQLAAREGYESVEHTKRYTTLGMATDQGKLSNINGLAILADSLNAAIPQVGTTTFRPPYTPISMGAIAGEARGLLFKPTRRTPMDAWHADNGAVFEPVADWRRPYAFVRPGEDVHAAVTREVRNTREKAGLLDASTLGKILVKGPDAARFLDLIYTNVMSSLPVGKCRYGLICNENGFLFDDGVVARLQDDEFLCHTTSGGAERVHGWFEEWLQTEWWDLKVYTANLTENYAQIAVVGPQSRQILARMGGMDVGRDALPYMGFAEGTIAGIPSRAYRISFSGELSYEVAVPVSRGLEFWTKAIEAGVGFGVMPYGTEALHVMRAEKGFIMIGDETDGTVIPQDLGLSWAVSKKKTDFIGKRAQERSYLNDPDRKQLVGLLSEDGVSVLPSGAHATEGERLANGMENMIGHVTSSYFSPTLGHPVAMALVKGGSRRLGTVLSFPVAHGRTIKARVVDPVFYDKSGDRQNA